MIRSDRLNVSNKMSEHAVGRIAWSTGQGNRKRFSAPVSGTADRLGNPL